ncbi:hypothetical protein DMP75_08870 [Klebsiella michiganensis]|nr:hypothetical protein DMP75_08870 [Klebsiella michiganensis]
MHFTVHFEIYHSSDNLCGHYKGRFFQVRRSATRLSLTVARWRILRFPHSESTFAHRCEVAYITLSSFRVKRLISLFSFGIHR